MRAWQRDSTTTGTCSGVVEAVDTALLESGKRSAFSAGIATGTRCHPFLISGLGFVGVLLQE